METENPFLKFLHVPLLILTNTVSITVLCLIDHRFTGHLLEHVQHHRTVTAVIVNISATLLAASQVYVLCTLINFATRLRSVQRFTRASSLELLAALSAPKIDWGLKWYAVIGTALFCLIGPLIGAVWAGALTPLLDDWHHDDNGTIQGPSYNGAFNASFLLLSEGRVSLNCSDAASNDRCTALQNITSLLASAQSATMDDNSTRISPRIDVPSWSYTNRSYGTGASPGYFSPTSPTPSLNRSIYTAYSYEEPGYLSKVTCGYNDRSNLTINHLAFDSNAQIHTWRVEGSLPNRDATNTSAYSLTTTGTWWWDEVLGWSAASANGQNILAIATYRGSPGDYYAGSKIPDHWYSSWNKMQCSITFTPTLFNVAVNLTTSRISVAPKQNWQDFEPTRSLQKVVMANLDLISRMSSNIGVSALGAALNNNQAAVNKSHPAMASKDTFIRGAENMLTALVDDLLTADASQQMVSSNGRAPIHVKKVFTSVKLGSPRFIYISMGINIALVLLVLAETIRTKAWQDLPAFNFTNLRGVMAAAMLSQSAKNASHAEDGDDVATAARNLQHASIRWSHNDTNDPLMLVKLRGDEEEMLQTLRPSSFGQPLSNNASTTGVSIKDDFSIENRAPFLSTTGRPFSSGTGHVMS